MSAFIQPCEPTLRDRLPKGEGWRYEVKFDGYRMQVHKADGAITIFTRNGADWTERFPHSHLQQGRGPAGPKASPRGRLRTLPRCKMGTRPCNRKPMAR